MSLDPLLLLKIKETVKDWVEFNDHLRTCNERLHYDEDDVNDLNDDYADVKTITGLTPQGVYYIFYGVQRSITTSTVEKKTT